MKALKVLIILVFATSVFTQESENESGPYRMDSFGTTNPYEEAAIPDERKIRQPSSEEIYKYKYELEQRPKWQDIEENCGDRCIYPDSRGK
ncbi:hypothetical protein M902_2500 [Bacteriovorax sp. BAL6_X]|uniref:hypothetical protein n=1 Tax=Bacteriovorax sp. BAL6_X TaxID=1201290 RepID=UPI0003864311|nr:hypothetical protein [Bacteriovorax sp. BAL6_X]EPZ51162.1 hypothetical protein M902_2500 [Bacteriovorax sp. BAL6_X]